MGDVIDLAKRQDESFVRLAERMLKGMPRECVKKIVRSLEQQATEDRAEAAEKVLIRGQ